MTRPDYSPAMLRLFLDGRLARLVGDTGLSRARATSKLASDLARAAGTTRAAVRLAMSGRANGAALRTRLWAALGVFPVDHRILLTDDGGQVAGAASQPMGKP